MNPTTSAPKDVVHHASELVGHQSPTRDADVDQMTTQKRPGEKPAEPPQLKRYLEESKKDGPFTNLQEGQLNGAAETAFIGSWTAK